MATRRFDEIVQELQISEERVAEHYLEYLKSLPLASLRNQIGLTQATVAERLGMSQAAVSKFEGRGDCLLSTFFKYVKAIDGRVKVSVSTSAGEFFLKQGDLNIDGLQLEREPDFESFAREAFSRRQSHSYPRLVGGQFWNQRSADARDITVAADIFNQCANDEIQPIAA